MFFSSKKSLKMCFDGCLSSTASFSQEMLRIWMTLSKLGLAKDGQTLMFCIVKLSGVFSQEKRLLSIISIRT